MTLGKSKWLYISFYPDFPADIEHILVFVHEGVNRSSLRFDLTYGITLGLGGFFSYFN